MNIPITKPVLGEAERVAVQSPLETGWIVQGPRVVEFEQLFAAYTGVGHAVATSSCTTALQVAMLALDLQPGDEVIVPAFTWISTANVVEERGARAVFCDVDLDTFNVQADAVAAAVTERTVGIIPVHLFGLSADLDPILETAKRHDLWVVEDAACSLGGWYRERHTGTFGDAGCFSFHPRKSITTGEGGMLITASDDLDSLARSLRDHGASKSDLQRHEASNSYLLSDYGRLGFNYRMTDFQGALGVAQMGRLDEILDARRRAAGRYDELLADVEWLRPPTTPESCVHGFQAYVTLYAPQAPSAGNIEELHRRRNEVMSALEARGIATRQGTHAAALQAYYVDRYGIRPEHFPNAWAADRLTIALPLFPQLTSEEQDTVVSGLVDAHGR
ncbi:MAG: DegT/DnrJ/EryC1/StrS family aminotransferase [Gaiellaceae bacterium]